MNDIDKLDGMIKFKGKCGYEFIGGCRELRKYKQALEKIREIALKKEYLSLFECLDDVWDIANKALSEVLNDRD